MRSNQAKMTIKAARSRLDVRDAVRVHSYSFYRNTWGHKMGITVRASARRVSK